MSFPACRIRGEGCAALADLQDVITANGIDSDWRKTGRHLAARSPKQFEGLKRLAESLGVTVRDWCAGTGIRRDGVGFPLTVAATTIAAGQGLIATDGPTGPVTPPARRQVIAIGSHMLATDPLPPEIAAWLIPKGRKVFDTRAVGIHFRLSAMGGG